MSDKMNQAYNDEHKELIPDDPNWDFRRELQMKYGTFKVVRNADGKPKVE